MARANKANTWRQQLWRLLVLLALSTLALQMVWVARVALMGVVDPQSTSFQRSEAWRLLSTRHEVPWSQQWLDAPQLGQAIARATLAAEDDGFVNHHGVEWDAVEAAWKRNRQSSERARQAPASQAGKAGRPPKIVGGSTVTQQLAKNLFLSGERTVLRKAQELVITLALEALLPKQRILEIYLNNVEWSEGVFGAQAAAQHYFRRDAAKLTSEQAARLAVLLPSPKRLGKYPGSAHVVQRAQQINQRMAQVELP